MIRKAIIPAAGRGTRMLELTNGAPKEMLLINDKPVIEHVAQEALDSGVEEIIIVIAPGKDAIREHFARKPLGRMRVRFVIQNTPRGLGHAVLQAETEMGDEPFAVLLGDVITLAEIPVTRQLIELAEKRSASVIALEEVARENVSRYGIIAGRAESPDVYRIDAIVEKPATADAPSNLAVASRYILTPAIFERLRGQPTGRDGEIQLTDAIGRMLGDSTHLGLRFRGSRFDTGNKSDYIRAAAAFAQQRLRH